MQGGGNPSSTRRLGPPRLDRGELLRPRLLSVLADRWDRRATVVVGGAGFGKSTLLGQAYRENLLAPRGTDLWFGCTSADNDAFTLTSALIETFDEASGGLGSESLRARQPTLDRLLERIGSSPPGTCLILDDLHEIRPGSSGHGVLEEIVGSLPHQCSLLVGSRVAPLLPFAEWTAKGLTAMVREADLAYTDDELHTLVTRRGGSIADLGAHGGWPALVELGLATGLAGSEQYLQEVVLRGLSEPMRLCLATLHAIGGGDAELVRTAAAQDAEVDFDVVGALPAMQPMAQGGYRPHALWGPALSHLTTPDERRAMQRRAGAELVLRGLHDDAVALFAAAGDGDGVCSAVRDALVRGTWMYPLQTLERWRAALPASHSERAEASVLDAITAREGDTFRVEIVQLFTDAVARFRERGETEAEVATLAEIAFVSREQGDSASFMSSIMRLMELAALGNAEIGGFLRLAQATMAEEQDDDAGVLAALAGIETDEHLPRQWRSRALWLIGHSTVMLGRPVDAIDVADACYDMADDDFLGARYLIAFSHWWNRVDRSSVANLPFIGDERYRTPFDNVYGGAVMSTLLAFAGDIERARLSVEISEAAASANDGGLLARQEYLGLQALSRATVQVATGDDAAASATLAAFYARHAPDSPTGRRVARRALAVVAVLVPGAHETFAVADHGPKHDAVLRIGEWFIAMRSGEARRPPSDWLDHLLNALPVRWAAEAMARYAAIDADEARLGTAHLVSVFGGGVRTLLREIADAAADPAVTDGARRLLASVPVSPASPVSIRVLGPMHVVSGIEASPEALAELRRGRVRQLISALVMLGPTTRERMCDLLWPDLDRQSAQRNLRTTLAYVHRVLEPDRGAGDAAFILRQHGEHLSLAGAPWVETDVELFEASVDQAKRAADAGSHSGELDHLESALRHVTGEPYTEVAYEEWAQLHVRGVMSAINRHATRAASLRFARGDHDLAVKHATLAVRFDRWSDAAHQILVAALTSLGSLSAAIDAYRAWASARHELGLSASTEMQMLGRRLGVVESSPLAWSTPQRAG